MRISVISWVVCVLGLIGLAAWLGSGVVGKPDRGQKSDRAQVGGSFSLVDGENRGVTDQTFRGRYMLVYFGFTHCPDICPTSLLVMGNALERLGEKGDDIVPIFITVDPERDTPEVVGGYVKHFGERFIGLTGSMQQVQAAADAYKVYFNKVEDEGSALGYMVDHSGFIYLMGPDGAYLTHFPHTISETALAEGLVAKVKP